MNPQTSPFWSLSIDQVLQQTHSTIAGLSRQDAKQRLSKFGTNSLKQIHKSNAWLLLLNQFKSPIQQTTVFAEVEPNQKERIIIALKKREFQPYRSRLQCITQSLKLKLMGRFQQLLIAFTKLSRIRSQ